MNELFGFDCPNCNQYCVYSNGDTSDLTVGDVQTVRCWACKKVFCVPEYEGDDFELADDQKRCDAESVAYYTK